MPAATNSQVTDLYGGAITAELPSGAIDASNIREVPDTQEVFLLEQPNKLDQSIIIDLLERVPAETLPEVIAVHLGDIFDEPPQFLAPLESALNEKVGSEVHTFLVKPAPTRQETQTAKLFVFLALIRVERVETDILVTMNVPLECTDVTQEAFSALVQGILTGEHLDANSPIVADAYKVARGAAMSLDVKDWSLFA